MEEFLKEYGNNYFTLKCKIKDENQWIPITLKGVLSELPNISMSNNWEESPAHAFGSFLSETLNNDLFEFLSYGQQDSNNPYTKQLQFGDFTSRVYKNSEMPSFDLKFRIYTGQKIGSKPMSTAKDWVTILSLTTPINSNNEFSLSETITNIGSTAEGLADTFRNLKTKKELKAKEQKEMEEVDDKINKSVNIINEDSLEEDKLRLMKNRNFGANVFELKLFPFIYKKPFYIYISNWTVTPSKEYNQTSKDSFYYDFSISCGLDRVLSSNTWDTYFRD